MKKVIFIAAIVLFCSCSEDKDSSTSARTCSVTLEHRSNFRYVQLSWNNQNYLKLYAGTLYLGEFNQDVYSWTIWIGQDSLNLDSLALGTIYLEEDMNCIVYYDPVRQGNLVFFERQN
jgi:hypothetical protein